jgi:hypothetical protein
MPSPQMRHIIDDLKQRQINRGLNHHAGDPPAPQPTSGE